MSQTAPSALLAARLLALREAGATGWLYVAAGERRAGEIARIAAALAPDAPVMEFPAWDALPYDRASPSPDLMGRRMAVLRRLADGPDRPIVVSTPEALIQRTPPRSLARDAPTFTAGDPLDPAAFGAELVRRGYREDDRVDEPGEFAIREHIADVWIASADAPCRLEVEDGRIALLRAFDPASQRSTADLDAVTVDPASEIVFEADDETGRAPGQEHWLADFHPKLETLFDALGPAEIVMEPGAAARGEVILRRILDAYKDRKRWAADASEDDMARPPAPPERLYLTAKEWAARVADTALYPVAADEAVEGPRFAAERAPARAFAAHLRTQGEAGRRLIIAGAASRDVARLSGAAERALDTKAQAVGTWAEVLAASPGALLTLPLDAERGFVDAEAGVALVTTADVLGSRAQAGAAAPTALASFGRGGDAAFAFGDVVIHQDHGVGVLRALETVDSEAAGAREVVQLDYAKETRLLAPVEELDRVWRYGAEEAGVALDRLDTGAWEKRRQVIEGEIAETARELVARAKVRDAAQAEKLVAPRAEYERFVERFPYPLTADQAAATEAVLADLTSGRPMERLVVGDVGFGKTEVAMRAAAAVALAGRQVAVAAPTTVLVRQHVELFRRRFAELGIEVAHLSRLTSPAEAKQVKAGLESGDIRVVVGTQALASESVSFRELGLLVIDEEQRFGASDKAKLRALGQDVHVLTLTATPIPRTLQTALVGLQDLSTIATPPARRRPVRTFAEPFDPAVIGAALRREKGRGGQSFVVVPRIEDMAGMAAELKRLAPKLHLVEAHGKMPAAEVDEAMVGFGEGGGDVLLATSIIESGLDVPRANTMIVVGADRFGLAQLHQLRGRVGRGRAQGVCYLTTAPDAELTEQARDRLATLAAHDRLGAGMEIAARDLDVRGAGDLIGEDQAGHVKLIGLGLYQHLLELAVRVARGEPVDDWSPDIRIETAAAIPESYVPEAVLRLNLHTRLARVADAEQAQQLADEIEDRFGPPPPEVLERLDLARLKPLCRQWGIARIDAGPQALAYTLREGSPAKAPLDALAAEVGELAWKGERLIQSRPTATAAERLQLAAELLLGLDPED